MGGEVGDIARHRDRAAAHRLDVGDRAGEFRRQGDIIDGDIKSTAGQRQRNRPADATGGAGDEGDLTSGNAPADCEA